MLIITGVHCVKFEPELIRAIGCSTFYLDEPLVVKLSEAVELTPTNDVYVDARHPYQNFNTGSDLFFGRTFPGGQPRDAYTLLNFEGPVYYTILNAVLRLYCYET